MNKNKNKRIKISVKIIIIFLIITNPFIFYNSINYHRDFNKNTEINEFPKSSEISQLDFTTVEPSEDYYDWDLLMGSMERVWLNIEDRFGNNLMDADDDVRFWIAPESDPDSDEIMQKIQTGSYSRNVPTTWLGEGSYFGDTQIIPFSPAATTWFFEIDSSIFSDYGGGGGQSIIFDCYAEDGATGDMEILSWESDYGYIRIINPSVTITSPTPGYTDQDGTIKVIWTHNPYFNNPANSKLGYFEVWVDGETHYTVDELDPYEYTFNGLSEGIHTIHVQAANSQDDFGVDVQIIVYVDTIPPSQPTLVSPSNGDSISDTTPYLDWNSISDAVNYRLQIDDNSGFTSPTHYETTNTGYTLPILSEDTHYWQVQAEDGAGNWGAYCPYWSFTIDSIPPNSPSLSLPSNGDSISDTTPYLDWNSISDAVNYRLQIDDNSGFTSPTYYETTNTGYTLPILSEDTHYWRVQAEDSAGNWGVYCTYWSFTIDTSGPNPPSLSLPSNGDSISDTTLYLDWNSVSDAVNYRLQFDDNSGFSSPTQYETTNTGYTLPILSEDTYYWRVQAEDSAGNWGIYCTYWSFTIDTIPPNSPSLSLPTNEAIITSSSYIFQWSSVADAVLFQIQISGPINVDTTTGTNSYSESGLVDGSYTWQVRCQDAAGNWGVYCPSWSFTVDFLPPNPPSLSLPLDGAWIIENFYNFQWNSVTDAVLYQIQISGPTNVDTTTEINSYSASGLAEGSYTWEVRCQDATGNWGDYCSSNSFSVDTIPPDSPILSLPSNNTVISNSSFTFQWNNVDDADLYQIKINGPINIDITTGINSYIASGLVNGSYNWQVRCQDAAENWGIWSELWSFTIENSSSTPSTNDDNLDTNENLFWDNLVQNGFIIPLFGATITGLVGLGFWIYKKRH